MRKTKEEEAPPVKEQPKQDGGFAAAAAAAQGAGFENVSAKDLQIPFLAIIQKGSPQVERSNGAYIKGAQSGDILNTATNRVYKVIGEDAEELVIIPCGFQAAYVEWKLRSKGGGFVATHKVSPPTKPGDKDGNLVPGGTVNLTADGTEIKQTAYHSVIIHDKESDTWYPAVISLVSTQLKKSRKWLSQMQARKMVGPDGKTFTPPSFANRYQIKTVPEAKNGNDWYGWEFTYLGEPDEEVFKRAFEAHKSFLATPALPAPPVPDDGEPEVF